ncbi:MAG TPA: hypothetical protein VF604_15440 [Pyrinomonadaceae bacterium]|jgi:hypothetical protein
MKLKILAAIVVLLFGGAGVFAQNGGKAEPNPITFAKGKSSATVSGKVKGDEQAEYVFSAKEGQIIQVKITSVPKGKAASFRILNPGEQATFYTKYEQNYQYAFSAPYTGDYVIWVSLPPETKVKSAKYNLTLTITKPQF